MLCGPSEVREAFLDEPLSAALGLDVHQDACSMGTLHDVLLQLEYLHAAYGAQALPERLVVGFSARMVANLQASDRPLQDAIDRYSPCYAVERGGDRPRLRAKGAFAGMASWLALWAHRGRRYTAALKTLRRELVVWLQPERRHDYGLRIGTLPSKFHHMRPRSEAEKLAVVDEVDGLWREVFAWRPDPEALLAEVGALREFAAQHGVRLYAVNMPEYSVVRSRYQEGVYRRYLELLAAALGTTPFLDLRTELDDSEFFDTCHPTLAGARKLSDRLAAWLRARPEAG